MCLGGQINRLQSKRSVLQCMYSYKDSWYSWEAADYCQLAMAHEE